MRLSDKDRSIIKSTLSQYMSNFSVFLFGSRVNDSKRGGDIDLFVKTPEALSLQDELMILAKLEQQGILRKIDLVLDTPMKCKEKFFETIRHEAIAL